MKNMRNLLAAAYLLALVGTIMLGFSRALPSPVLIAAAVVLVAIPLIREFLHRSHVDERQLQISRFSTTMAFYAYLIMLLIVLIKDYLIHNQHPGDAMLALLVIPLAVKLFISLLQNHHPQKAARAIALFFAGVWLFFVLLSHGLSLMTLVEMLPFLLLVGLALATDRWPRVCGVLLILIGLGFGFFFVRSQRNFYAGVLLFTVLALPMLLSGIALLLPGQKQEHAA